MSAPYVRAIGHRASDNTLATESKRCQMNLGRCSHGVVDPDWCYDCFYEETPSDEDPL